MTTFKSIAYQILKEAGKPLHSKEITKRALERGLVTDGKTPEATMNALLVVDINTKKKSRGLLKQRRQHLLSTPILRKHRKRLKKTSKKKNDTQFQKLSPANKRVISPKLAWRNW